MKTIRNILIYILIIIILSGCSAVKPLPKTAATQVTMTSVTIRGDNSIPVGTEIKPAGNSVIVIDPGHGNHANLNTEAISPGSSIMKMIDGGGASGIDTGIPEYKVNMSVALKLKILLESMGYTIIMTKTDDSASPSNRERAEIANNAHAALEVRIHADSNTSSGMNGASMLVPAIVNDNTKAIYDISKNYGNVVLNKLISEVGMRNNGVVERSDLTGFNWAQVPVILIEMGFLSNPTEEKLLSSDEYQSRIAQGLADGITAAVSR